ncbi:MAG: dihydrodipicolinate synthase family protein [Janthinobacterium lividum]
MLLQGLYVPLTCPFNRQGKSYFAKLAQNVRRYSLGPVAGLVAFPSGGEAAGLSDAEVNETLRTVAASAAKEKVLLAAVESGSVHVALERAEMAAEAGFDAILLAPPSPWVRLVHGQDARELLLFYQCVADASPLPILLWSSAEAPSFQLPVSMVAELAQHPNIIAIVDAELSLERLGALREATASVRREVTVTTIFEAVTRRMLTGVVDPPQVLVSIGAAAAAPAAPSALKTRTKSVGFQILSAGYASETLPLLQAGVAGMMPTLAACAPQGCFEAYAAWKDGDPALAAERGARLRSAEALLAELGPAAVKYAADWNGYFGGAPRLPRLWLTGAQRTQVEKALGEVRN